MKKYVLFVTLLIWGAFFSFGAQQSIPMQIVNGHNVGNGHTYAPARPWYITQDDYVFTLSASSEDYTLVLLNEDGEIVYTDTLLFGSTMFILPSTLSGNYDIRLVPFASTYYYRGFLTL